MKKKNANKTSIGVLRRKIKILAEASYRLLDHLSMRYEEDMLRVLVRIVEERDPYTLGHSVKVTRYALLIAKRLGLPQEERDDLREACLLHDIGKIAIDRRILNKEGPLAEEEWEMIKRHPDTGAKIARESHAFRHLAAAIKHHHEKFAGGGYPAPEMERGRIPLYARIIAIADAWDAMLSDRAYRKALSKEAAAEEIRRSSGTQFDPHLATLFLKTIGDVSERDTPSN